MEKYVENRRINYMKATGIVRRIDDLGRVVIPKEIRRTLRIREGDPLEIFTDREGEVILKKYSPIGELTNFAGQYAESIAQALGCLVCICDTDQVITASGNGRKELQDKYISSALRQVMDGRKIVLASEGSRDYVRIVTEQELSLIHIWLIQVRCQKHYRHRSHRQCSRL